MVYVAVKVTTVFSGPEGTFLRRNLFLAFGVTQVIMAVSILFRFESDFQKAGATVMFRALVMGGDGLVLLHDSIFRKRPLKPSSAKSK